MKGTRQEKGLLQIAAQALGSWCRREESNPRPSHYE
jgi:hypothetical protein